VVHDNSQQEIIHNLILQLSKSSCLIVAIHTGIGRVTVVTVLCSI